MGSLGSSDELTFLLKWATLDEEARLKQYSKYQCHEVNLFLYFKDQDFFNLVVKPHILNKMAKDFVDHWLLGNKQKVEEYKELIHFNALNAFEKCLLLSVIVETDKQAA